MCVCVCVPEMVWAAVTCLPEVALPEVAQTVRRGSPVQTLFEGLQIPSHRTQTGHSDRDKTCKIKQIKI